MGVLTSDSCGGRKCGARPAAKGVTRAASVTAPAVGWSFIAAAAAAADAALGAESA